MNATRLFPKLSHHVIQDGALRAEAFSFATPTGREIVANVSEDGRYLGTVRLAMPRTRGTR